ncbi:hypothetical protein GCM10023235_12950 [Kitasatospora terrestris]|uniref:Uncharacterized protein n=1 Tax=Kitasatospora terrestris TaxID=258051 RepID=A0ABP9DHW9_9ACTN
MGSCGSGGGEAVGAGAGFVVDAVRHFEAWGVLAYACSERDDEVLSEVVLGLVDRGWAEVCRFESWTAPNGDRGLQLGAAIARGDLGEVLADPGTWDDPADVSWVGVVTLRETEEWLRLSRRIPDGAP